MPPFLLHRRDDEIAQEKGSPSGGRKIIAPGIEALVSGSSLEKSNYEYDLQSLLRQSLTSINNNEYQQASEEALAALQIDELCGQAWYLLGLSLEKLGNLTNSISAYEAAHERMPELGQIANDVGRLAMTLGQTSKAAQYFAKFHFSNPDNASGANNLACALTILHQFDAAIEVLQKAIIATPESAMLWNTLGTVLSDRGDPETALPFFQESARLAEESAKARYNLASTKLTLGAYAEALEDCEAAIKLAANPAEAAAMSLGRSSILLCQGRIGEGWDQYEARLDPAFAAGTSFLIQKPCWDLEQDISGKSLLLFGEQGLGDQVAFAGIVPDLLNELGENGRLTVAVEPRLIPLFRRSFPTAEIVALGGAQIQGRFIRNLPGIDESKIDLWTPMASPLRRYRRAITDYPARNSILAPDPARTAGWREVLEKLPGLKVGVAWKSLNMDGVRRKFFPPFEQWQRIFATPGVSFVNLQYGDCAAEIAEARERFGVEIWQPPEIDLKDDLDEVAALTCATDLVIGPSNATTCIAASCGVPVWIFTPPASWPFQGTEGLPWFPSVRGFVASGYAEWEEVMGRIANALADA